VPRIAFRLDPALHGELKSRAATEGSSQGQVVLDSVEATQQRGVPANLITGDSAGLHSDAGMFPRRKTRTAARTTVPVEIRLHARAVAILDELAAHHGAESRAQLVTLALKAHRTDQV
jgi:hypothetical protein